MFVSGAQASADKLPDGAAVIAHWSVLRRLQQVLTTQRYFGFVAGLLFVFEVALLALIIRFIPYTEIDFSTYMQQSSLFISGERQYSLIKGDTGPLVYPAGFLYIYSGIHYITRGGLDIRTAQSLFAQLYLVTLGFVFEILRRCGSVPPYALVLLCLSKRLHSIYALRLFNEAPAMLLFYAAVLAWTRPNGGPKIWTTGTLLFSLALSIKMNFLLYLPGLLYLFYTSLGVYKMLLQLLAIGSTQMLLAVPFLGTRAKAIDYFATSFNFGRDFLWEWTVNWRWVGQPLFEGRGFSELLLVSHAAILIVCGLTWSWKESGPVRLLRQGLKRPNEAPLSFAPTPERVCKILFLSNLVGIVFARSLHYQFYAWYAHQIVFLLWQTEFNLVQRVGLWLAIEVGWETFPSTTNSSLALTIANLVIIAGVLYKTVVAASHSVLAQEKSGWPAALVDFVTDDKEASSATVIES
ncbi:BZ3500_MvSof-1268-A1-R1_Chr8-1g10015 [Microbotryum saponariae]|uniref:Dol-P-Man:Man(5)GlcNAc(2)-PP-Dol alpha-1,3-mannosyltransferase n=1 Tax=Microbotryum saponariae TaxID=289078 RepID=A0A2X0MVC7_9BASI|nr:BZ3500_MvSof-1268-A1-R1_Chr8-1g10015 [Microbotryum saponariae]SDA08301.1 BZ3501_MvSof-1269-A2-R1_Chr8-1g09738 [Microbotryum saponariae]